MESEFQFSTTIVIIYVCIRVQLLQSCLTFYNPMDSNPPGSSVHGILQARILEWVAIPSSRGSSWPRDQTCLLWPLHCRLCLYLLSHLPLLPTWPWSKLISGCLTLAPETFTLSFNCVSRAFPGHFIFEEHDRKTARGQQLCPLTMWTPSPPPLGLGWKPLPSVSRTPGSRCHPPHISSVYYVWLSCWWTPDGAPWGQRPD